MVLQRTRERVKGWLDGRKNNISFSAYSLLETLRSIYFIAKKLTGLIKHPFTMGIISPSHNNKIKSESGGGRGGCFL